MNIYKSLEYLKSYVNNNIDTENLTTHSDYGIRALLLKVQQDYRFNFGLPSYNRKIDDLIDAVKVSYPSEEYWMKEFTSRDYVSDVIMGNNIEVDDYAEHIKFYKNKLHKEGKLSFEDGYELTHWVWALAVICKDNHIMSNYQDLMSSSLISLYLTLPASDLKTECLYFLSLIDLSKVKEDWIINLELTQKPDGTFHGEEQNLGLETADKKMMDIHHLCLSLLTLYNYYNSVREN